MGCGTRGDAAWNHSGGSGAFLQRSRTAQVPEICCRRTPSGTGTLHQDGTGPAPYCLSDCRRRKTRLGNTGSGRLLDTILLVHGGNVAQELIKFQASYAWGQVQGYLGSPRLAKGNRSGQIFIMNGRVIQNQTLRVALEKAYHGLLPSRAFPWALLAVELRPELVDCNVHPAKAEVRFAQEQVMFSDILQAVRSGLSRQNLAPTLQQTETPRKSMPARTAPQTQLKWEPETWQHMDELLKSYRQAGRSRAEGAGFHGARE